MVLTSQAARSITIKSAMNSDQLSKIKREHGEGFVLLSLTKILKEACSFVNNDLSVDILMSYSELLLSDYWMLRIDDFILAVKNGIRGQYGKVYGALDYPKIAGWLDAYQEQKDSFVDNKSYQSHVSSIGTMNNVRSSEEGDKVDKKVQEFLIRNAPKK